MGIVDTLDAKVLIEPGITYARASGRDLRLDFFRNRESNFGPTLLYFHGGGWMSGSRESRTLALAPWLARGFNVANASYRLGTVAKAPAAVEDARCALQWLFLNASRLGVDSTKIVVAGDSSGGHLALMMGLLDNDDAFCNAARHSIPIPQEDEQRRVDLGGAALWAGATPRPAAVVNFYGVSDLLSLATTGDGGRGFALAWLGDRASDPDFVHRLSPRHRVTGSCPPVISIHGRSDRVIPFSQSVELHQALTENAVANTLELVEGGHGQFDELTMSRVYAAIFDFLDPILAMK